MNEKEYLLARIKYLEETLQNKYLPSKIKSNQQKALQNYKKDFEMLQKKLF